MRRVLFKPSRYWVYMARRSLLGLLLCATMLAGCIGVDTPEWGSDGVSVDWNGPDNQVNITSSFGNNEYMSNLTPVGCNESGQMPTSSQLVSGNWENSMPVTITGWASAIHHYSEGAGNNEDSVNRAISTTIVVEYMSYDMALQKYETGDLGTRVQVKDWGDPVDDGIARPYAPETTGQPKLELQEENTDFVVAGLIPSSESILEGMEAINWHEPVKITGYMLYSPSAKSKNDYYPQQEVKAIGDCVLTRVGSDGFRGNILVMTIETPDERMTLTEGYSSSVGGLNTWLFTVLILAAGGGGAFGLFFISTIIQRQGASAAAKVLLGEGSFSAAKEVKQEAKIAKREGFETEVSIAKKAEPKPKKKEKEEEVEIKGFSLDSILGQGASHGPAEAAGGGVLMTEEADEIEQKKATGEYDVGAEGAEYYDEPAPRSFSTGGFVGGGGRIVADDPEPEPRQHFSSTQASINEPTAPKTRKTRKAVRRSEPEPQDEPKRRGPPPKKKSSVSDDEDFSDFSL